MKAKFTILGLLFIIILTTQTACTNKSLEGSNSTQDTSVEPTSVPTSDSSSDTTPTPTSEPVIDESALMGDFDNLASNEDVKLIDIIAFIETNIATVSLDNATSMILRLEELQIKQLPLLEEKYYPETMQKIFQDAKAGSDFSQPENFKDTTLKALVQETIGSGYKVEQAEGMYYPVIDYSFYEKFSSYATPDIKEYLAIMAVESNQLFAKDAALVIGWDEVINRALVQEQFLINYDDSKRSDAINELYKRYEFIAMFGLNNTPMFDYESKIINEKAKTAYEDALAKDINSEFLLKLKGFMDVVLKNDNKLTDEVEQYRRANTDSQLSSDPSSNRYYVAGIDDAAEFEETFLMLQKLVENDDKNALAEYIAYPFHTTMNKTKITIKTEDEFVAIYDKVMTDKVKKAFLNQKVEETFVNDMGVSSGEGAIWISQILDQKHKYSIYGINN